MLKVGFGSGAREWNGSISDSENEIAVYHTDLFGCF
jgi:hypothetical protein